MVVKNNFFFEEELLKSRNSKKLPNILPRNVGFNIQNNISSPSIKKTKLLFPIPKDDEIKDSNKYQKLVIKVTKDAKCPKTKANQYQQLLYFSRIEKKEINKELELKNKDTYLYDHNDNIVYARNDIDKLATDWANDKYRRGEESISRHILLSVGGKVDKDKALVATSQFLKETFGAKGFEYCYAPHYDTENDHIHVVVKKRNHLGKNFRFSKSDLQKFKVKYHEKLGQIGIKRDISRRLEDDEVILRIREQQERLVGDNSWYQNKLNKGNQKEFNAYTYKATLSGKTEEQVNIIKIKEYLNQLGVKDEGLINIIKPYLRKKGIKSIEESLFAVKQMQTKNNDIKNLNGFILQAIKEDYKASFKNGGIKQKFQLSPERQEVIRELKSIKEAIIQQNSKKDIIETLNKSVDELKKINIEAGKEIEEIFKDKNIRYSYVKPKKEVNELEKKIIKQREVTGQQKIYYRPDLTDYEIQEKFAEIIRQATNISPVGLETAISKAFSKINQKIRFGNKSRNEICWYGEAGYIKDYKTGEFLPWGLNSIKQDENVKYKTISEEEFRQRLEKSEQEKIQKELLKQKSYEEVAKKCQKLFSQLSGSGRSIYLEDKKVDDIKINGVGYNKDGSLIIPLRDINNKIWNLQTISQDGKKLYKKDGKKQGNFFLITKSSNNNQITNNKDILLVAEGLATALTVHRASNDLDTIVCFDAGNLEVVITNIKEKYPARKIVIMADDDKNTEINSQKKINPGLVNANKVKEKYPDVDIMIPSLTLEEKTAQNLSDFNDLEKIRGKKFVKEEITSNLQKIINKLNFEILLK